MSDKAEAPEGAVEPAVLPPDLRFLKTLVTVLAGVMILGLLTIVALLVIRFYQPAARPPVLPEAVVLPKGMQAKAVTFGTGWYAVVTTGDEILIYDSKTGELRQRVPVGDTPAAQ